MFMELFQAHFPKEVTGAVLDLGCGPADITRRFAQTFEKCQIDGVDGSANMLKYGHAVLKKYDLTHRIRLIYGHLPEAPLPVAHYEVVIANSLLHHLAQPRVLWETIKIVAKPQSCIFVMDLMRPESVRQVEILVKQYAAAEPKVLQRDFFNSLCAAYRIDEVEAQLQEANLTYFQVHEVSDRHFMVTGRFSE
jgi:ubiquinone/menaquinone biosynthesis C-methylase UbiE